MQEFKEFSKYLLLAQLASDAGKGYYPSAPSQQMDKSIDLGYIIKDKYISQAIGAAKKCPNVKIGRSTDIGMTVILFDIKGYGQVSFHCTSSFKKVPKGTVQWNGIRGGSIKTCKRLARKFNLPFYEHEIKNVRKRKKKRSG